MPEEKTHNRFDCHMHTPLCGHSRGEPRQFVDAAAENGISMITFTCHIPMPGEGFGQQGIRMTKEQLPQYRELVDDAREYGSSKGVEVLCGIEAEIHPDKEAMKAMDETLAAEPFDFILGSLHHMLPLFRQWLADKDCQTDSEKIAEYFRQLAAGATTGRYHSLSHPDVIRIYGALEDGFVPAEHEDVIKESLDKIAGTGMCMEINTSGLIKGDFVVHPDPLIMRWALERDIPFTIGSDSHRPGSVGQFFDEVIPEFKKLGLKRLHYFKQGQRIAVEI